MIQDISLPSLLNLSIQVVLPLLVGLVTRPSTPAKYQAYLLMLLTAVNQFVTIWLQAIEGDVHFDWKIVLANVIGGLVISIGVHLGIWKPVGATNKVLNFPQKDTSVDKAA